MENDQLNNQPQGQQTARPTTIYEIQSSLKATISSILGIIVGVGGILIAFLVSLLYNPEGSLDLRDKFYDPTFWIMWAVILTIVIFVSMLTYRITKKEAKARPDFIKVKEEYQKAKVSARPHFNVLGKFTQHKNKEILLIKQQEIVESADLDYERFLNGEYITEKPIKKRVWYKFFKPIYADYDESKLISDYQQKRMKAFKQIKIKKIYPQDLTHDTNFSVKKVYSHLPEEEKTAESKFMVSKMGSKIIMTFVFLFVGTLSFSWQGWVSAFTNAFGVALAWIGAVIQANEYVENVSKTRYIAQTDLLIEFFDNVADFIKKPDVSIEQQPKVSQTADLVGIVANKDITIQPIDTKIEVDDEMPKPLGLFPDVKRDVIYGNRNGEIINDKEVGGIIDESNFNNNN